jgi:hypothetical protein
MQRTAGIGVGLIEWQAQYQQVVAEADLLDAQCSVVGRALQPLFYKNSFETPCHQLFSIKILE